MPSTNQCSERIYESGSFRGRPCHNKAKVQRMVKGLTYETVTTVERDEYGPVEKTEKVPVTVDVPTWFCGQHDPVAIKERQDKKWHAESTAEGRRRNEIKAVEAKGAELIKRLGAGRQAWHTTYDGKREVDDAITVGFVDIERLLAELGREAEVD